MMGIDIIILGGRGRGESETLCNPEGQKWHQPYWQLAKGECEEIDSKLVVLNPQIIPTQSRSS